MGSEGGLRRPRQPFYGSACSSWGACWQHGEGKVQLGEGRGEYRGAHLRRNWIEMAWWGRSTTVLVALFVEQGEKLRETESWRSGAARRARWWRSEQAGGYLLAAGAELCQCSSARHQWRRCDRAAAWSSMAAAPRTLKAQVMRPQSRRRHCSGTGEVGTRQWQHGDVGGAMRSPCGAACCACVVWAQGRSTARRP